MVQRLPLQTFFALASVFALLSSLCLSANEVAIEQNPLPYGTPDEQLARIVVPDGYRLELVLSDPQIKEPVVCVFDGNGRMYVAEFRSYMQDIDGTGQMELIGCVSRHESSRGDGVFDKHSIFAEKLLLPRMVLPLDDRILINETNTNDIFVYRDTNGDGISDSKEMFFPGGPRGGNLEHQQSGLVWAMDNWMYQAVNSFRLRYTGGEVVKEQTPGNGGQWGLCQDDLGKVWFTNGGGEKGPLNFQIPIIYGGLNMPGETPADFKEVFPIVGLADVQGGTGRFRPDNKTLNHFTATCGHGIVRGDRLPEDLRGDMLLPEPVGRLIRRIKIANDGGLTVLSHPHDKSEFIRSTDANFRPVNITSGPDGCIYIVDMYRGIIQEGNWTKPGSYLRDVIVKNKLDKNAGRGRIWRLVHKDFKPGPQPHMLDETPAQLVEHLSHPNGWWRDTAQKLLVLKGDKSVVPALEKIARTDANLLARLHALWTLEGLNAINVELVREMMKDPQPQIRVAAIRFSEPFLKKGDPALLAEVQAMKKDKDPNVFLQVLLTGKLVNWAEYPKFAQIATATAPTPNVQKIGAQLLLSGENFDKNLYSNAEIASLQKGKDIYQGLCFACHGFTGTGMPMEGGKPGITLAPPLGGSRNVVDNRETLIRILLHGLSGPVNGKTYDAQMVAMNGNDDEWIANIASYIRNSFGNAGPLVSWADVARIRMQTRDRTAAWTDEELQALVAPALTNTKEWKVTGSHNAADLKNVTDGKFDTRWTTKIDQEPGMWVQIELPQEETIAGLWVNAVRNMKDFPRGLKVELSTDGTIWGKPVLDGKGTLGVTHIKFPPAKAKFIRMTQTAKLANHQKGTSWSIAELRVLRPGRAIPETPPKKILLVTAALDERLGSIPVAERLLTEMGTRSGAFNVDILRPAKGYPAEVQAPTRDAKDTDETFAAKQKKAEEAKARRPALEAEWRESLKKVFAERMTPAALKSYDGVIFANTSGELPLPDTAAFTEWVKSGKAFVGIHGAASTLRAQKPYVELLGGAIAGRPWDNEEVTLKVVDRRHPSMAPFESTFEIREPIVSFTSWTRDAVHPLLMVDASNEKRPKKVAKAGEPEKSFFDRGDRTDKDYAVAWTRDAGEGRVFYTSLGVTEAIWQDATYQQHVFGGICWALRLAESKGKPAAK